MKRVLITGKNSYIGTSVENWLMREPDRYLVNTIDVKDESWRNHDFSQYDVVLHVAGIVHKRETPNIRELYFHVNRDLSYGIATKAKNDGASQFIFMSTMSVYGEDGRITSKIVLNLNSETNPKTIYGESKLEAERLILSLNDSRFKVLVVRPPMVYGSNCPGNYAKLEWFAKSFYIFPYIENQRSMIHIDNLCNTIESSIQENREGITLPQDKEYINTSQLVYKIASENGKKIYLSRTLGFFIKTLGQRSKLINKVFGNLVYENTDELIIK